MSQSLNHRVDFTQKATLSFWHLKPEIKNASPFKMRQLRVELSGKEISYSDRDHLKSCI